MEKFSYVNAKSVNQVPVLLDDSWENTKVIAGGTDLVGEMKDYIETPKKLVNLKTIPDLDKIEVKTSGVTIGALVTLSELVDHPEVQENYGVLAQAAAAVATPQIRNVGTVGGNLCQRPRCWYYRDPDTICLKKGGDTCYALSGLNKYHAIFGGGPVYIVHPSDVAPALVSLGASVTVRGTNGDRTILLEEFFVLPDVNPQRENILEPNEIITQIHIPKPQSGARSLYIKIREKGSFDFALVSVAAVFEINGQKCQNASIVLGGVAPIPWRSKGAEAELKGQTIIEATAKAAGRVAIKDADPLSDNAYKVQLTENIIYRAAMTAIA
tara:strand:- start:594 stop:1571 length:978 start_codon:yes stop_codon:yes gene_type:complete